MTVKKAEFVPPYCPAEYIVRKQRTHAELRLDALEAGLASVCAYLAGGEDVPSDGEIYSMASFGGDREAKARFIAETTPTPKPDQAEQGERDLIERLRTAGINIARARKFGVTEFMAGWEHNTCTEAAAEIERLTEHADTMHGQLQRMIDRWEALSALGPRFEPVEDTAAVGALEGIMLRYSATLVVKQLRDHGITICKDTTNGR
jgi:hypothetical protein